MEVGIKKTVILQGHSPKKMLQIDEKGKERSGKESPKKTERGKLERAGERVEQREGGNEIEETEE